MSTHKSTLVPVHHNNQNKRAESIKSVRSRTKQSNGSPQMSLFSWLDFEKGVQVHSVTASVESERPNSQLSNFSGIDEDIIQNRADTVDSGNFSVDTLTKRASGSDYHKIIVELNNELLNSKTENVQLKFRLDEAKAIMEMEWTERVRRLSNENRNILEQKIALEKYTEELKLQLNNFKSHQVSTYNENELIELKMKIELFESERTKDEIELFQSRNILQDLQIKLETKEKAAQNLKEQIIEMHTKNQDLTLKTKRLENETSTMSNEIEMLKKSEGWYKNELHECQNKKLKLQEDIINTKNELQVEKNKNGRLFSEFTQLLRNCEDIEAKAVREKESMMRRLENIQANLGASLDKNHLISHVKEVSDKHVAMNMIEELKKDNSGFLHRVEQQDTIIKQLEHKCNTLLSKEGTLQKQLSDKTMNISLLETKLKEYEENIRLLESQCDSLNYQNLDLKAENEKITIHYDSMSKEKEKIDETVQKLRNDFEVIMIRFQQLNEELSEKDRLLSNMNIENKQLLEKSKENELNAMKNICNENQLLKGDVVSYENKIKNYNDKITQLERDLKLREAEATEMKNKIGIKEQEIELLTESNCLSRKEISQLINQLQSAFDEIKSKNRRINSLLEMNQSLEENFNCLNRASADLEGSLKRMSADREILLKDLNEAQEKLDIQVKHQNELQTSKSSTVHCMDKAINVDSITPEIEALKAEIEILQNDYTEKLAKSEAHVKSLMKKLKEENLQKKIVEQNMYEKNDLALLNAEMEAKVGLLGNKCSLYESKCSTLEAEIDKIENEHLNIIKFLKENNALKGDDLMLSLMHLFDELNLNKVQIIDSEKSIKQANGDINRKSSEIEKLQKEIESLKTHIKSSSNSMASMANYEAQIIGLQSCVEAKNAEIISLNKECQFLHEQIKKITQQCDEFKLNIVTTSSQNIELSDKITDLKNQLHSNCIEIQILEEKCETFKNIERNLVQSKDQIVREMQQLRKELSVEHNEKIELQKLVSELKVSLSQLMEGTGNGKESESKSYTSLTRKTDFSKTIEILEKSAKTKSTSLAPLQECVDSLKQEMDVLNKMIRQNSQFRSEVVTEMSLMDELKAISER